jgi:hypothetical protein
MLTTFRGIAGESVLVGGPYPLLSERVLVGGPYPLLSDGVTTHRYMVGPPRHWSLRKAVPRRYRIRRHYTRLLAQSGTQGTAQA